MLAFSFASKKLFGQTLDPLFVENRDKRKVLPMVKKNPTKGRSLPFFFVAHVLPFATDTQNRKPKWNKNRFFPEGHAMKGGDSATSSSTSFKQKGACSSSRQGSVPDRSHSGMTSGVCGSMGTDYQQLVDPANHSTGIPSGVLPAPQEQVLEGPPVQGAMQTHKMLITVNHLLSIKAIEPVP